jgi:small subunit ribosomal protein S9
MFEIHQIMSNTYYYGIGRRKRSSVRAKYYENADLIITVNGKDAKEYLTDYYYKTIDTMLTTSGVRSGKIELFAIGGGVMGQAEAARLAIAKALIKRDEAIKPLLKQFGFTTTDNRKVLPKRPGLQKARKARQWVKR